MNRGVPHSFSLRLLSLSLIFALAFLTRASADDRPNILFIMADDHGYQAISAYGSVVNQTPNIDRIAKEGMRFDRCFVTNSLCGPARATILTGKYSHLHGFKRNGDRFDGSQPHVAKYLQQAGYQTAVIGKWHLASDPTGFDYWKILQGQGPYYNPVLLTHAGKEPHTGYTTEIITEESLKWLKEVRDPNKPFFLLSWHKAPHRNWQPAIKNLHRYHDVTIPEPANLFDDYAGRESPAREQEMTIASHMNEHDLKLVDQEAKFTPEQLDAWNKGYEVENEAFRKANLQGDDLTRWKYQRFAKDYLRCIDSVDESVGEILKYLEESGLADNTLVIYSSDQGWYLGEHGWYDKRWMYEESFRTPLLMRWPKMIKPESVNRDLVMNLDLPETFMEMAGLKIPSDMQGVSLLPLFEGKKPADWRSSVYYHYYEFPEPHRVQPHLGIRTDRYKLIFFPMIDRWEFYDLENDPQEMQSGYNDPKWHETIAQLKADLLQLREQYNDLEEVK